LEALPNEGRGTGAIVKIIGDATKGSYNFFKDGGNVSGTACSNGCSLCTSIAGTKHEPSIIDFCEVFCVITWLF
jgi:hypothetical protein